MDFHQVEHGLYHPVVGDHLAVVGYALFGLDEGNSRGLNSMTHLSVRLVAPLHSLHILSGAPLAPIAGFRAGKQRNTLLFHSEELALVLRLKAMFL